MARSIERPRVGLVCIVGLTVSLLAFARVFAQANKTDRRSVDLDGDGRVSEIEELVFAAWIEYLPELAEEALAAGIPKEGGTLDISTFLKEREAQTLARLPATPPIETLMLTLDDPCAFIRGDANRDGTVDLADVIFISDYVYGGTRPENLDAADVKDDGQIDLSDAIYLSQYLFSQGPPPPAPFPSIGLDPTYDHLEEQCADRDGFEHPMGPRTAAEMPLPPAETAPLTGYEPMPGGIEEPSDGTGGFTGIAPELPILPGPGGLSWGHRLSYKTRYASRDDLACAVDCDTVQGVNWFWGIPYVIDAGETADPRYWVRWSADAIRAYRLLEGSKYGSRYALNRTVLVHEGSDLVLYDVSGRRYVFHDMEQATGIDKGRLRMIEGLGGARIELFWDGFGKLERVEVKESAGAAACQKWLYTYLASAPNKGRLETVEFQRSDGQNPPAYRKAMEITFRYFVQGSGEAGGTAGDLMEVGVRLRTSRSGESDLSWLRKTYYYRYWTGPFDSGAARSGSAHQVRWVFGPDSAGELPANYQSADLSDFRDCEYAYCADRRLKILEVFGRGCCGGNLSGVHSYTWYLGQATSADLTNTLHARVKVELPDETLRIIDYNAYGQKLFDATRVGALDWVTRAQYDAGTGGLSHLYFPSICASYSFQGTPTSCTDPCPAFSGTPLASYQASTISGLRYQFVYTTGAGVFKHEAKVAKGTSGTAYLIWKRSYDIRTSGDRSRYLITKDAEYPSPYTQDPNETIGNRTTYAYTYYGTYPLSVEKVTTSHPVVSTGQNGSGSAVQEFDYFDALGARTWHKDGAGRVDFFDYDPTTWTLDVHVRDINTASPPPGIDIGQVPDGFGTTTGLNILTFYESDDLAREVNREVPAGLQSGAEARRTIATYYTKLTAGVALPADREAVLVYPHLDGQQAIGAVEIRTYTPGGLGLCRALGVPSTWDSNFDDDWDASAADVKSALSGGSNRLLERRESDYDDRSGLLMAEDVWTDAMADVPDENYQTSYGYSSAGRLARIEGPLVSDGGGFRQIERRIYDGLGRLSEVWLGSCDNGWQDPPGSAGTADMVCVRKLVYDAPDPDVGLTVGDGHLTFEVQYTGDPEIEDRITYYDRDYRGRALSTWEGYDPQSVTGVRVTDRAYDNLDRVTMETVFEGDTIGLAQTRWYYDPMGRIWRVYRYQAPSWSIGERTWHWYDARGLLVKTRSEGDIFRKRSYDGAGRPVSEALSFDIAENGQQGGSLGYAPAFDLLGDTVVEEKRYDLDLAGNILLETHLARHHDGVGTGPLVAGTNARRTYRALWYDILGRVKTEADYGTNDGAVLTRPPAPPGQSDADKLVTTYSNFDRKTTVEGGALVVRYRKVEGPDIISCGGQQVPVRDISIYDDLGRVAQTFRAYCDGTPDAGSDRRTVLEYDGLGHVVLRTVWRTAGEPEKTKYVWGVRKDVQESLASLAGVLGEVWRPDAETGDPDPGHKRRYGYDALGERRWSHDGLNEHTYERDLLGRVFQDDALGAEDGETCRIEYDWDALGRLSSVRSRKWSGGTRVVDNELEVDYGSLGEVVNLWQEHDGTVDRTGPPPTPKVSYTYEGPTGSVTGRLKARRPTGIQYPNTGGLSLTYGYGVANGVSDILNRIEQVSWLHAGTGRAWKEQYLGAGRVVEGAGWITPSGQPEDRQVQQSVLGGEGQPKYAGLDRFDRTVELKAVDSNEAIVSHHQYTYDYGSQRTSLKELTSGGELHSETYTYDALGQVVDFRRGQMDGQGQIPSPTYRRTWTYEAIGNWDLLDDPLGSGDEDREHNRRNEITEVDGNELAVTYLDNGNVATKNIPEHGLPHLEYEYDAWNRLWRVRNVTAQPPILLVEYEYNGLGWLIRVDRQGATERHFLSAEGRPIQLTDGSDTPKKSYVGGGGGQGGGWLWLPIAFLKDDYGPAVWLWMLYDADGLARTLATAQVDGEGAALERYEYTPYGHPSWLRGDFTETGASQYHNVIVGSGIYYEQAGGIYLEAGEAFDPQLGGTVQCADNPYYGPIPGGFDARKPTTIEPLPSCQNVPSKRMGAGGLYEYRIILPEGERMPMPKFKAPPRMNRESPARFKEQGGMEVPELPKEEPFKRRNAPAKPTVASSAGTAVSVARFAAEVWQSIEKWQQLKPDSVKILSAEQDAIENAQDACDARCAGYPCDEWGMWCAGRITIVNTVPDPRYMPQVDAPPPPSAPRMGPQSGSVPREDPYYHVHIRVTVNFDCTCEPRKTWYRLLMEGIGDIGKEIAP